jgi:hypothetical protein
MIVNSNKFTYFSKEMKNSNNVNVRSLYFKNNKSKGLDVQAFKQMKLNNNNLKHLIFGGNEVDQ